YRPRPRAPHPQAQARSGQRHTFGECLGGPRLESSVGADGRRAVRRSGAPDGEPLLSADAGLSGRLRRHGACSRRTARSPDERRSARRSGCACRMAGGSRDLPGAANDGPRYSRGHSGIAYATRQACTPRRGQRLGMSGRYLPGAYRRSCKLEGGFKGEKMKRLLTVFSVGATLAFALPATAQEALAKKYACFACHAVDKKLVGPAYKDVAAKYRGRSEERRVGKE